MNDFRFERPGGVAEATALLAEAPGRASILAGGTDLLVELRAGVARPELVVDVKRIPELSRLAWTDGGELDLGACTLMERIAQDERIRRLFPALAEGAVAVGSLQIRHRATVGGNLANASPCMDTAPPLLVYGARVQIAGATGTRELPLGEFFRGVKQTVLAGDELIVKLVVPRPAPGLRSAFAKVKRVEGHDLALVNAAAAFDPSARTMRVAVGSVAITPVLAPALTDVDPSSDPGEVGARLAAIALEHIAPIDDVRASAEYRHDMTAALCHRLAARLLGGTES